MGATYPAYREADVVLRDGSTVHLRPVRASDEAALLALFERLGEDSRMYRFFSGAPNLERAARELADVDYADRYGLVATRGGDGSLVGHGAYVRGSPQRAEVAFAVADEMQGQGLGTIMLAHLAEVAEGNGIPIFVAEVLPENHRMIEVFRESGLPVEIAALPGLDRVKMPTSFVGRRGRALRGARPDRRRWPRSRHFLRPAAVAVIGASRRRGTVGGEVFHNLLDSDFGGAVYPVNPAAEVVQSVRAYSDARRGARRRSTSP